MNHLPQKVIHYTDLAPAKPGDPNAEEWETYRREVHRLLAEGHEGRFAIIEGREIVAIVDTEEEAWAEGYRRMPRVTVIRHILTNEPLIRLSNRYLMWRASNSQLPPTG